MNMDKMISELIRDEGLKLKAYTDTVGKRTVGVGRNFQDVPFTSDECLKLFGTTSKSFQTADQILSTRGITEEQARYLLKNDIEKCLKNLEGRDFWKAVKDDDDRARAIVNLCFNLGIGTLLTFKNTLAFITKKDWANAANNLVQSKWYVQVGQRAVRIVTVIDPNHYKTTEPAKPTVKKGKS